VLVLRMEPIYEVQYTVQMASDGMIYVTSFMKLSSGIQVI
jgi:hypothetical protein